MEGGAGELMLGLYMGLEGKVWKGQGWAEAGMGRLSVYLFCLPALQVAEIQKIELPVILSMIDGVHILGEVELAHTCSPPDPDPDPSLWAQPARLIRSLPNVPTAPHHGSAAHCSHTGQRRSQKSHLWGRKWAVSTRSKGWGIGLGFKERSRSFYVPVSWLPATP